MPYILCGGHTITTNNDGTFYINVQSPNGKKADYAAYTIGPFGTGFGQAGEYTAQRWDTSDLTLPTAEAGGFLFHRPVAFESVKGLQGLRKRLVRTCPALPFVQLCVMRLVRVG